MSEKIQAVTVPKAMQWDVDFGAGMTQQEVKRLLSIPPFSAMDAESFPAKCPLDSILLHETRILRYKKGGVVIRQGDYGSSAFLILSGSVQPVFDIDETVLGRQNQQRKTFKQALKQLWEKSTIPEVRRVENYRNKQNVDFENNAEGIGYLKNADEVLAKSSGVKLKAGALFGEISALTRSQRSSSVIAAESTTVLEIKWQGLRDLMQYNRELRTHIEKLYRDRSLTNHMASMPLLKGLSETQVQEIASKTVFESHGRFDWHIGFKSAKKKSQKDLISTEPLIVREGEYADDLIIIRSGFARVSRQYNNGHRTITYLSQGDVFEMDTLIHNCSNEQPIPYQNSLRALGYADVLKIPTALVKQFIMPQQDNVKKDKKNKKSVSHNLSEIDMSKIEEMDLMNFFVENRFINGTKTMLINLDRCVGCDDCVTACANAHNGNPRFIRHGERHGKFMIANACMHCSDPVCMIGCPTGAINRTVSGEVVINDVTCIGCSTCANACPYNNIRMVNVRNEEGTLLLDEKFSPIVKASKCDLCVDQMVTPSCEYACPHNALKRLDIRDINKLSDWLN